MATPTSVLTAIDVAHWTAGQPVREYYLQTEILQNLQYLIDQGAVTALNSASQFWLARSQQAGKGNPFA